MFDLKYKHYFNITQIYYLENNFLLFSFPEFCTHQYKNIFSLTSAQNPSLFNSHIFCLSLSHDARSLSVGYGEWKSSNSRQSHKNQRQRHRMSKRIWRPTWASTRRTLLLSLPAMIWSPIVLKDCIFCEFFYCFIGLLCFVLMGLVQWLAVFGLLWVFGCGGLQCSGCCGFLGAVARGWLPVF